MSAARTLALALLAIAALFAAWFTRDAHALAGLLVFVAPPLLLAVASWRGWPRASTNRRPTLRSATIGMPCAAACVDSARH